MKIVILGSGTGSNALAILEAEKAQKLGKAQVVAIFCDNEGAKILSHGKTFNKPAHYLSCAPFITKLDGEAEQVWIREIQKYEPDLIVLAGYMRVLKPPFIEAFRGKIINLHPSLLPSFPGLNGIGKALEYGVKITGCTVHWVEPEVDAGKIIDQLSVRVEDHDTLESLATKVHAAEHQLLPQTISKLSISL